MTVLGRYAEARQLENPSYPLTSQALIDLFARSVSSGVDVNETTSLGVPAVRRAVSLIAGTAAGLPLKTYRDMAGERTEVRTALLEAPYPAVTPFEHWRQVYVDLLLWGNSYQYLARNDLGAVVRLLRISPWEVTVERDEQTPLNPGGKWFRISRTNQRYGPTEIMHVMGLSLDGLVGLSPIQIGAESVGIALAAEQTAAKMFGEGMLFAGILSSDQDLDQASAETLGARFRKMIGSRGPGAKIPVLGRGTKFEKVSMEPERAQFLESRSFQVREMGRLFDVDPALLFDAEAVMNFGEAQKQNFLDFTMEAWLRPVEQAVTTYLLPRGQFAEYNRGAFLRADTATRYQTHATAVQFGLKTRNEARADENLPPLDGLDDPLTPVNLGGAPNEQPVPGESPAPDAAPVPADSADRAAPVELEAREWNPTVNVTTPPVNVNVVLPEDPPRTVRREVEYDAAGNIVATIERPID